MDTLRVCVAFLLIMKTKFYLNYEFKILYCLLIILKLQYSYADFETCDSTVKISNWTIIGCSQTYTNHPSLGSYSNSTCTCSYIHRFLGIPYAEPPIGDLRFSVTKPKSYSNVNSFNANKYGNVCIQPPFDIDIDTTFPPKNQSEDCLVLNVWTTTLRNTANNPVMVFIHGGAFLWGSADLYDGSILALRGVVVVTMNYRLGAFGFMCTKDPESPGNQGLYDQIEAIKWVKNNIRRFGGDPNQITVFGESAGSMSVSNLMVSPLSYNLFNRAILQSGTSMVIEFSNPIKYADEVAHRFASNSTLWLSASKPGICNGTDWIECMREKSALDILLAQSLAVAWNPTAPWYSADLLEFVPCFGDNLIPNPLNKSLELGEFSHNIEVLLGHNEMEGAIFTWVFDVVRLLGGRYQPDLPVSNLGDCFDKPMIPLPLVSTELVYSDITNSFIDNKTINQIIGEKYIETFSDGNLGPISENSDLGNSNTERYLIRGSATHAFGDYILTCPTVLFGNYLLKSSYFTGKVYQYKLTYANSQSPCYTSCWCNATHFDEVPLVFGFPFTTSGYSDTDRQFSIQMIDIWTDFAKYGNPSLSINKIWPPYSVESNGETNLKYFELNPHPLRFGRVVENSYNGNEYRPPVVMNCKNFWDKIIGEQF